MLEKKIKVNTKVLVRSKTAFGWAINPYNGCSHGCRYCYGMGTTHKCYTEWIRVELRKGLIERLKEDIRKLKRAYQRENIRDIFLGAITDSYQPLERKYEQTKQVIEVLTENELPFSILTKNDLVLRDIDLLRSYKWCRVGVTITSLDENFRKEVEPFTVDYGKRIEVLAALKENGISTYLSCEPIMPVVESDPLPLLPKLRDVVNLFDFGIYTNHGEYDYVPMQYLKHYKDDKFYYDVFSRVIQYCNDNNINYCISSHSRSFFKKYKLPFKPYPLLKPKPLRTQMILADFLANTAHQR